MRLFACVVFGKQGVFWMVMREWVVGCLNMREVLKK